MTARGAIGTSWTLAALLPLALAPSFGFAAEKEVHWSFRPLSRPAVPAVARGDWARTPVDAFILAALEARGLSPSPPADRRTLIRRVSFDLVGLPPTPEEVEAFAADPAPDAYEALVDRLLASPRFGERWARHWMDVVHFAETHGNDQDRIRPNAWPYRDYLIRAFNQDRPYARFVEEQIAGDVLFPLDPEGVVATGLIAAGPWDESSQLNIVDDTVDKKIARNLDRDDMVSTVLSTFASATVHCARCHDHKFDPISQKEYYQLQAVFAGVDRADRPYDADPAVHRRRLALLAKQAALQDATRTGSGSGEAEIAAELRSPQTLARVEAFEKGRAAKEGAWTVLDLEAVSPVTVAAAGATGTPVSPAAPRKLPDGSLLYGGEVPERAVYVLAARSDLRRISALRLEVLADPSLPHGGPGRQANGNLHLSEISLEAAPVRSPSSPAGATAATGGAANPGAGRRRVRLRNPSADFNQGGWGIERAIDGKGETAWGIYPKVGEPHRAVFELEEPVDFEGGSELTITLEQNHGGGHLIGRPRLSVTAERPPPSAAPIPERIAAILARRSTERTEAERTELSRHVLLREVDREIDALPAPRKVYAAASDFPPEGNFTPAKEPRPIHVLSRGDVASPLEAALPGALSCVPGPDPVFHLEKASGEGSRRAALARWLTDGRNGLVWRSIANRIWHHHFGRGIADSPNDLGRMGAPPTHPELLDHLAGFLLETGGSLKSLHRLIVTSAVYTQSSEHRAGPALQDAGNLYLWRMSSNRLDAESIHDAVLVLTDRIDLAMGGPSVKQFNESPGVHVTPTVDYTGFDVDRPEGRRRSVYRFIFRTLPDPFMDSMDCPDASQLAPARSSSVTALQALSMLNNPFMVRGCEHLQERLERERPDLDARIDLAWRLVLGRPPRAGEAAPLADYARRRGLANACRLLLNSNEFVFLH